RGKTPTPSRSGAKIEKIKPPKQQLKQNQYPKKHNSLSLWEIILTISSEKGFKKFELSKRTDAVANTHNLTTEPLAAKKHSIRKNDF
ncbi:MAG TPA: hypothetical protein H9825_01670, partial [Candidatus Sphingobacterium stercorigallinarum]|nr:hypothetical protein [Candidatus Sphingobacterium stercorigallinarum]